jgi:hypothetical protein
MSTTFYQSVEKTSYDVVNIVITSYMVILHD